MEVGCHLIRRNLVATSVDDTFAGGGPAVGGGGAPRCRRRHGPPASPGTPPKHSLPSCIAKRPRFFCALIRPPLLSAARPAPTPPLPGPHLTPNAPPQAAAFRSAAAAAGGLHDARMRRGTGHAGSWHAGPLYSARSAPLPCTVFRRRAPPRPSPFWPCGRPFPSARTPTAPHPPAQSGLHREAAAHPFLCTSHTCTSPSTTRLIARTPAHPSTRPPTCAISPQPYLGPHPRPARVICLLRAGARCAACALRRRVRCCVRRCSALVIS